MPLPDFAPPPLRTPTPETEEETAIDSIRALANWLLRLNFSASTNPSAIGHKRAERAVMEGIKKPKTDIATIIPAIRFLVLVPTIFKIVSAIRFSRPVSNMMAAINSPVTTKHPAAVGQAAEGDGSALPVPRRAAPDARRRKAKPYGEKAENGDRTHADKKSLPKPRR